jgi:hypothetical protein
MHIYASDGVHTAELDIPRDGVFHVGPTENCLILSGAPIKVPANAVYGRTVVVSISDGDYAFGTVVEPGSTSPQ